MDNPTMILLLIVAIGVAWLVFSVIPTEVEQWKARKEVSGYQADVQENTLRMMHAVAKQTLVNLQTHVARLELENRQLIVELATQAGVTPDAWVQGQLLNGQFEQQKKLLKLQNKLEVKKEKKMLQLELEAGWEDRRNEDAYEAGQPLSFETRQAKKLRAQNKKVKELEAKLEEVRAENQILRQQSLKKQLRGE
jgi:hypothetical protein